MSFFVDRRHAGRVLASALRKYSDQPDLLVLALPRGGVPVAYEVARELAAPLDVLVVRRLGVPGEEELAMGALASGGVCVLDEPLVEALGISREVIVRVVQSEERERVRRETAYRGDRPPPELAGRTLILVDDGLATGSTMRAAIEALRQQRPERIVAAVPVATPETCEELSAEADETVCAATPQPFHAVGLWYENFSPTSDEELRALLAAAERERQKRQRKRFTPARDRGSPDRLATRPRASQTPRLQLVRVEGGSRDA